MKYLLRIAMLLFALCVLTVFVYADESQNVSISISWEAESSEPSWESRIEDESVSFTAAVVDNGTVQAQESAVGSLEMSWRFSRTDWSGIAVICEEDAAEGGFTKCFDPIGENAILYVRCFLSREDGVICVCRSCEIVTKDGRRAFSFLKTKELTSDRREFSFRFETFPNTTVLQDTNPSLTNDKTQLHVDFSDDSRMNTANAEAENRTFYTADRSWTYRSSDARSLWTVDLKGSFYDDLCVSAAGHVSILDDAWSCESAEFYPDSNCAVALVVFRRYTLGIPVATKNYEFRLYSNYNASSE